MAEILRCPTCFTIIKTEDSWTDDPILTKNGLSGEDYKGFSQIKPEHIIEIQDSRRISEINAGIPALERTEFTKVKEVDAPGFFVPDKKHIRELRESTEKVLNALGLSLDDYFNYDEDGTEYNIGEHQTNWYTPDLDAWDGHVRAIHIEDLRHPLPEFTPMILQVDIMHPLPEAKEVAQLKLWGYIHSGIAQCHYYFGFYLSKITERFYGAPGIGGCYNASQGEAGCAKTGCYGIAGFGKACGCGEDPDCLSHAGYPNCAGLFINHSASAIKHSYYSTVYAGNQIKPELKLKVTIENNARPEFITLKEYTVAPVAMPERSLASIGFLEDAVGTSNLAFLTPSETDEGTGALPTGEISNVYEMTEYTHPTYTIDENVKHRQIIKQWDVGYPWARFYPASLMDCLSADQYEGKDPYLINTGLEYGEVPINYYSIYVPLSWDLSPEEKAQTLDTFKQVDKYNRSKVVLYNNLEDESYKAVQTFPVGEYPDLFSGLDDTPYPDVVTRRWKPLTSNSLTLTTSDRILTKTDGVLYVAENYYNESYLFGGQEVPLQHGDEEVIPESITVIIPIDGEEWTRIDFQWQLFNYDAEAQVYYYENGSVKFGDGSPENPTGHGKTPSNEQGSIQYCTVPVEFTKYYANGDIILTDGDYPYSQGEEEVQVYVGIQFYNTPNMIGGDEYPFALDIYDVKAQPGANASTDCETWLGCGSLDPDYAHLLFWGQATGEVVFDESGEDCLESALDPYRDDWMMLDWIWHTPGE